MPPFAAKQIPPYSKDSQEEWVRDITDPRDHDVHDVNATRSNGVWTVNVQLMEFIRNVPLEDELREKIQAALEGVEGVTEAGEEDREIWTVFGTPTGSALVDAVGAVLDELADRSRVELDRLK